MAYRIKVLIVALILLVMLLSQLAGCGGGGDEPEAERSGLQPVACKENPEVCR